MPCSLTHFTHGVFDMGMPNLHWPFLKVDSLISCPLWQNHSGRTTAKWDLFSMINAKQTKGNNGIANFAALPKVPTDSKSFPRTCRLFIWMSILEVRVSKSQGGVQVGLVFGDLSFDLAMNFHGLVGMEEFGFGKGNEGHRTELLHIK